MIGLLKRIIYLLVIGVASPLMAADYDIVIKNGLVIEGNKSAGKKQTVAINKGRIVYVGPKTDLPALKIIDATGLVVAPGFIDVHNHAEVMVLWGNSLNNESYVRQGVTTVVTGADGKLAPEEILTVQEYITDEGSSTNVAVYVGHNNIRKEVMGRKKTAPNNAELAQMKALVKEGMELGAVGLSSGLMYNPAVYSRTEEVIELAKVAASYGGSYDAHVRDPAYAPLKSFAEVIEVGRKAHLPVKIAHVKLVKRASGGDFPEALKLITDARAEGINVVTDQYPYDGAQSMWLWQVVAVPQDMRPKDGSKPTHKGVAALLGDPEKREKIRHATEDKKAAGFSWIKAVGYTSMRIVVSDEKLALVGKYFTELAKEQGKSEFDVIADMIIDPTLNVNMVVGSVGAENVRNFLRQPWNMVSSDGAWSDDERTMTIAHPRSTGTYPRILEKYVREEKLLTLPDAIYHMSGFPADFLGLGKRGYIRKGYAADIAIFDPETIAEKSDWVHPERLSEGMVHVLIDGKFVLENAKITKEMPGRFVPHSR